MHLVSGAGVRQEVATVVRRSEAGLTVDTGSGELPARRAVSCLVDPEVDDRVLVALVGEAAYVLAVLEREATGVAISVEGDLALRAPGGRVAVTAAQDIALVSPEEVSVSSPRLSVTTVVAELAMESLTYAGRFLHGQVDKVKMFAKTYDGVFDRLSQTMKRSYRVVEESDHLRAERLDYRAEATMKLHAKNALVTSEQLVKVDGDQIHLG